MFYQVAPSSWLTHLWVRGCRRPPGGSFLRGCLGAGAFPLGALCRAVLFLALLLCLLCCPPSVWCPLILSFCLNDAGLGLSKMKSLCFVTGPEHWRVGGTPRE